ncbi:MAG: cystathionine beta-lyase [Phenylobacterium sp.]|nr:cystathionine beta-lyase [Phenylobacterium sp.]
MDEETRLIRAGAGRQPEARTVGPAVQRGSTVLLPDARSLYDGTFGYGRAGLNAQFALAEALAELEGAASVQLFPSGLAAVTAAATAVLKTGDHVLIVDTVYKPVRNFADDVLRRFGVAVDYYDARLDADGLMALARPETRLILLESPGSLTFEMQDVAAIAAAARSRGILTLADNTWGAGLLFKPLAHGVDISVQALTKYVCGHSDVFMGSVAVNDDKLAARIEDAVHHHGWAVTGEDAYQALRGLRTLATRLDRHGASGLEVARWLAEQPETLAVLHPALPGAPGHDLWTRDFSGACGLFSVVLTPAPDAAVAALLDTLKLFGLGFSWGGFESLAINCDPQFGKRRAKIDYGGPVIRLHIGLEAPADLIADLRAALDAYGAAGDAR